ncbi:MAG TPA: hypothetical protein VL947_12135 [Cytophagales bacterium]|nr:hypothetical protein [Cytophagales bacterium]
MKNFKIQVDPEDLDKKTTDPYKNFNKVERRANRFYTMSGLRNLFKRNKLLFVVLFVLWLATFVWLVADVFQD